MAISEIRACTHPVNPNALAFQLVTSAAPAMMEMAK
jgi:hypothetical protein